MRLDDRKICDFCGASDKPGRFTRPDMVRPIYTLVDPKKKLVDLCAKCARSIGIEVEE